MKNRDEHISVSLELLEEVLSEMALEDLSKVTIREVVSIVNEISEKWEGEFLRMEMGVPGLKASEVGVHAEKNALDSGVAHEYPLLQGNTFFQKEASRFIKAFINIDIPTECCLPSVGAMQGSFALFLTLGAAHKTKSHFLFIDPGFPVQKLQLDILGYQYYTFDSYHYRGGELSAKLESYLKNNDVIAIIYSNPNNPTWVCFTPQELELVAQVANKYNVTIIEDLAYLCMDFRTDYSKPFEPPYQPSIGQYSNNYALLISASKIFSYAGQRCGLVALSQNLFHQKYQSLLTRFHQEKFGRALIGKAIYALSAGVSHSSQLALAEMFKEASDGTYNFLEPLKIYAFRAAAMKQIFVENGFNLVYEMDGDVPIADGFYFTVAYNNISTQLLMKALLLCGISAMPLGNTGSVLNGVRICVSYVGLDKCKLLNEKLQLFSHKLAKLES